MVRKDLNQDSFPLVRMNVTQAHQAHRSGPQSRVMNQKWHSLTAEGRGPKQGRERLWPQIP